MELKKQRLFVCLVEQAQMDVLERTDAKMYGQKVDLVEIEGDPFSQKVELPRYWVFLAQLRVVLMD